MTGAIKLVLGWSYQALIFPPRADRLACPLNCHSGQSVTMNGLSVRQGSTAALNAADRLRRHRRLGTIVHVQFAHQRRHVRLYRRLRDAEIMGDLLVQQAKVDTPKDFALRGRELVDRRDTVARFLTMNGCRQILLDAHDMLPLIPDQGSSFLGKES